MYLVTGGAGFIGSHVVNILLARGEKVICLDNFNDYYDPAVKRMNIEHNLENPNFFLCECDIRDFDIMRERLKEFNIHKIIHLAAMAGVRYSIKNPGLYEEVNVKGTMNMLELARLFSVDNFVFASSSSVYGNNKKVPFAETDNVDNPISPYAATKKAGELLCYTYHHLYKIPIICFRFFTVYGPRGRPDMAPLKFTKLISAGDNIERYGDGTTARDYTYISDIVDGVIAGIDNPLGYEIINLGNTVTVKLNYLISVIEKSVGKKANIVQRNIPMGDVNITYSDITKARNLLGYSPKVKIDEGVSKLVEWYKK